MRRITLSLLGGILTLGIFACLFALQAKIEPKGQAYEPKWESLTQHPIPQWFQDAKFGIYFHWGVYSVPAFSNEWYPRNMYRQDHGVFKHHRQNYGPQNEFGYKNFIPLFKAEKFDADEWVDLFVRAGAKFAGPVAEHHDGFAMWNTGLSEWNAKNMGPKRDIVGELEKAVHKRGLKFVTSFHHAFNWKYYEPAFEYDAKNPKYAGLYGTPHEPGAPESAEFLQDWQAKVIEVIDNYHPDYLWFDFGWKEPTFDPYKRDLLAYYYNQAAETGQEVVVSYKDNHLPSGAGVLDLERGRLDSLREELWITDTSIDFRSWCYIKEPRYKTANMLVDNLVDRVSKNGNTLLNIAPRPDGTIPEEQKRLLLGIGEWLKVNGEAIYGTRYWCKYGEGPTKMKGGAFGERHKVTYTEKDVRFTTKGDTLYAIVLDWPGDRFKIESLKILEPNRIRSVSMLGTSGPLDWQMGASGMVFDTPKTKPCEYAYAVKIVYDGPPWPANTLSAQEKEQGWQLLFDGKTVSHWRGVKSEEIPQKLWVVENGELVCVGRDRRPPNTRHQDIISKKQYSSFEFQFDFKISKDSNSGVKYFVQPGTGLGLEYQIWDDTGRLRGRKDWATADLYDMYPAVDKEIKPLGEWNRGKIVVHGSHVQHWLNGKKVVEYNRHSEVFKQDLAKSKYRDIEGFGQGEKGHILLQDHGGGVSFRNLKIMEL